MESGRSAFSDTKYIRGREKVQPFKLKMLDMIQSIKPGDKALDIGCGTGFISESLRQSGLEVTGIDISEEGIRKYCAQGLDGKVIDVEKLPLPFPDGSFDVIWASEVIEHIVDYDGLLSELHRILKENGRLYLTCPNSAFVLYRIMYLLGKVPTELQHPYHLRFFSPKLLTRVLKRHGFKIDISMGQNIYALVPVSVINSIRKLSEKTADFVTRMLVSAGFKQVDGLIHGDKLEYYRFSSFLNGFFSNVIMVIARKGVMVTEDV